MHLKPLNPEQTAHVYETLLLEAFPPAELKPLSSMDAMMAKGLYVPYGLFRGDAIIGACYLRMGQEGVTLVDYLCVDPGHRNQGLGELMLAQVQARYPGWVVIAESEYPPLAPDEAMAERRLGFYRRNGAQTADFLGSIFDVVYTIFYWGPALSVEQYRDIYQRSFSQEKMDKHIQIPYTPTQEGGVL